MPKVHRKNPPQTHQNSWRWQLDVLMLMLILTIALWISVQIHLVSTSLVMDAFFGPPGTQIATSSESGKSGTAVDDNAIVQSSEDSKPPLTGITEKQQPAEQETIPKQPPQQKSIAQTETETAKPVKKPVDNVIIQKEEQPTRYVSHRQSQSQPNSQSQPQHSNVTSNEEESQENAIIPPQIY